MRLAGKVWLITGATGIAAATARLAIEEGARVFVASLNEADCRALSEDYHAGDLTEPANARAAVVRCLERCGRIDALYNVAGISGRRYGDGPVHECTDEGYAATLDHNLKTTFLMCREALGHMLARAGGGAILNMASVTAFAPEPRHFATHAYAASKGAIIALTRAMAAYYAPSGIRVNAIAPGLVRTPMSRRAQGDAEILALMKTRQPLAGDLLSPEQVARASVFLLSDDAVMITGQVLAVDAGWSLV